MSRAREWLPGGRAPRCISLSRVSQDPKYESVSHETQHEGNMRCIAELGGILTHHLKETVSGALYEARTETQQALAELENDEADYLILYSMDRYGRSVRWQQEILARVEAAEKRLQFATFRLEYDEQDNRLTPYARAIFNNFGNMSEMERYNIRERTIRGIRRRVESGSQVARTMNAYGLYVIKKADVIRGTYPEGSAGTYIINDLESHIPRLIFEKYRELQSVYMVASWMNVNGHKPRSGRLWRPSTIRAILRHPIYKGVASYGRFRWRTDESRETEGKSRHYQTRRPDDQVLHIECPALVSPELWDECNRILDEGRPSRSGPRKITYALTGLVFCHLCGRRMYTMREGRTGAPGRYSVKCARAVRYVPEQELKCEGKRYAGNSMEEMIADALACLTTPTMNAAAQQYESRLHKQRKRIEPNEAEKLEKEIKRLKARELSAAQAAVTVQGAFNAYEEVRAGIEKQRVEMESKLKEIRATQTAQSVQSLPVQAIELSEIIEQLKSPARTAQQKHDIMAAIIERVYPLQSTAGRPLRKGYNLQGVQIVLKTKRPGPWWLLTRRITKRGGGSRGNLPTTHETTLTVHTEPPLPGLSPDR